MNHSHRVNAGTPQRESRLPRPGLWDLEQETRSAERRLRHWFLPPSHSIDLSNSRLTKRYQLLVIICHGTRRPDRRECYITDGSKMCRRAIRESGSSPGRSCTYRESTQRHIPRITSPTLYIQHPRVSKRRGLLVSPRSTTNQAGLPIPRPTSPSTQERTSSSMHSYIMSTIAVHPSAV